MTRRPGSGWQLIPLPRRSRFARISLAVALPLQALLVNEWLRPVLDPTFEPAFIAAVAVVCWLCGLRYALASLVLATLLLDYFFLLPYWSLALADVSSVIRLGAFLGANAVTLGLIAGLYRAQEAIATSEIRHRNLAELIPFGGWTSDANGGMTEISESFLNTFGATEEECLGLGWAQFIDEGQREAVLAEWKQAVRNGYFWDYEYLMRARSGRQYVVLSRGVPVRDSKGRARSWVGIHLDITERNESVEERLAQARDIARFNAELEQLAYVSAHDLQEPLRMIASYLQLLERRYAAKLDDEAKEFIGYAVEGATRLRSLLGDLLILQQIGKGGRSREVRSLCSLVNIAVKNLGDGAAAAAIRCGPLPSVECDAHEFIQLFEHLIANAILYAREGVRPEIDITADRSNDDWVVSVRDNGMGIDSEFLQRIFNVFQRLHPRTTHPGTGIGLAICRKVVEVHGGRIWAESTPGLGSTFRFTIPQPLVLGQ